LFYIEFAYSIFFKQLTCNRKWRNFGIGLRANW